MRCKAFFLTLILLFSIPSLSASDLECLESKACEPDLGALEIGGEGSNLTSLESEPSSSIFNCVSVISGDYSDTTTDHVVPGPDPLPIQRVYSSAEMNNGNFCYGTHWGKGGHLFAVPNPIKGKENLIKVINEGGYPLTYSYAGHSKYALDKRSFEKGLTNTYAGVISGRTNLRNNTLSDRGKSVELKTGGGHVSEFKQYHKDNFYLLEKEKKANGLEVSYDYHHTKLVNVRSQNNDALTLASFSCDIQRDSIKVSTSDNRTVHYQFQKLKGPEGSRYYLKKASRPNGPDEDFTYASAGRHEPYRLAKKMRPDGRGLEIEYYNKGDNPTPFGMATIKQLVDPRFGRVRCLKAPVGQDSAMHPIYTFTYSLGILPGVAHYPQKFNTGEGRTKVFDAYMHLTQYFYNEDHRLTCVEKHEGAGLNHTVYSREKLFWDGQKLTNRMFETKEGWAQYARQYDYDDRGNISRQTLWGNLTGGNTQPICYPASGYPEYNGCEAEVKLFTYTNNHMNLLSSETDGKTYHTAYAYHANTDLLASKLTGPVGSIALREFYEYDKNGVLVVEIKDDGISSAKEDLTGITARFIKRICPSTTMPIGLPLIIEEKYLDLATGTEDFFQKVIQTFTQEGWLATREVYDRHGSFAYAEQWEYDSFGKEISYVDAKGHKTTKAYDANLNLIYEQGPCPEFHTEYFYDFSDRLIKKELVCHDGLRFTEEYFYDLKSNLIASRDTYGNKTRHEYDEFGRRTKTYYPEVLDENGAAYTPKIETVFNVLSFPTETTDARGGTTRKKFTIKGSPYSVTHPDGSAESFVYHVDGTIQKEIHKNSSYTVYEYDYQKRPTKKETFSSGGELLDGTYNLYSGFKLLKSIDLGGTETSYTYDSCGRMVETNQGSSRVIYGYDAMGRQVLMKTFFGAGADDFIAKVSVYNNFNEVIEEREEDSSGKVLKKSQFEYDLAGNRIRVIEHTQSGPSITSTAYDPYGRPIEIIDPLGYRTTTRYDYSVSNALGQIIPYEEITDPKGNVFAITKDALGRTVSSVRKNALGREIQKAAYFYDANGNKTRQIDTVYNPDATTREIITAWQYDPCNKVISLIEAAGAPEQKLTQIHYNAYGQKDSVIKPDGVVLHNTYDELGRLETYCSSDGTFSYLYAYDVRGNVIQVDDHAHATATTRSYDTDDRLISEVLANGLTVSYAYDLMGRPISTALPDASAVEYSYEANRLREVKRVNSNGEPTFTHTYEHYDLGGLLLAEAYAGKAGKSSYGYDVLGRLSSYQSPHWKESVHAYDAAGNLLARTVEDGIETTPCSYQYDDLYQISQESGFSNDTFQSDSLYNRVTRNDKPLSYNALNQLICDGDTSYTYDLNGNLTRTMSQELTANFVYDALDRLTEVTKNEEKYRYYYDELNRRLSKTKYAFDGRDWLLVSTERYVYHNQNEVGVVNEEGQLLQYRMLGVGKGAEIGSTVLLELDGSAYVPMHDHNGNICCLVNAACGSLFETYQYTSFGEESLFDASGKKLASSVNPWRFSSKRVDEETGFIYFGRRYYLPQIGRWITADPIGFDGGPNLYAYVLNNPLTHFDLYGLYDAYRLESDGWFSSVCGSVADQFSAAKELMGVQFNKACRNSGNVLETTALHCIPIPYVQDKCRALGWYMQDKNFDDFKTWRQNKSYCSNLGFPEIDPKNFVLVAGGLLTYEQEMFGRAKNFSSRLSGNNVHYFYNSTHGAFADAAEWAAQRSFVDTRSVKVLAKYSRKLIKQMGGVDGGGTIHLFVHSQSGEITNNLQFHLSPAELKMLNVRTFGSPMQIPNGIFGEITNYASTRDFVPLLSCYNREFVTKTNFLPSKEFWGDHGWDSPTYQRAIKSNLHELNDKIQGNK